MKYCYYPRWFDLRLREYLSVFPDSSGVEFFYPFFDSNNHRIAIGFGNSVSIKSFQNYVSLFNKYNSEWRCYYCVGYSDYKYSTVTNNSDKGILLEFERRRYGN